MPGYFSGPGAVRAAVASPGWPGGGGADVGPGGGGAVDSRGRPYDVVALAEYPDDGAAVRVAVTLRGEGNTGVETLSVFTEAERDKAVVARLAE